MAEEDIGGEDSGDGRRKAIVIAVIQGMDGQVGFGPAAEGT